jgi:hypothetical protein
MQFTVNAKLLWLVMKLGVTAMNQSMKYPQSSKTTAEPVSADHM